MSLGLFLFLRRLPFDEQALHFAHRPYQLPTASGEEPVAAAAPHGRSVAHGIGMDRPYVGPRHFNGFIERTAVAGVAHRQVSLPDLLHEPGGGVRGGIRVLYGVEELVPMLPHPRRVMAGKAGPLHEFAGIRPLLIVHEKVFGVASVEVGGEGHLFAVMDNGRVRPPGMGVSVNQPIDAPGEPIHHPVGPLGYNGPVGVGKKTYVAGRAGRGGKILARSPGDVGKVPLLVLRGKYRSMLARLVNLAGGSVRARVALLAGMRLAGRFHGKIMTAVACRTRASAAVGVDAADSLVGPPGDDGELHLAEIRGAELQLPDREFRAVAVQAGVGVG